MAMLFRDYVELLYQFFLQDKKYIETLRDKIKSDEFNKDQMYDPAFENWKSIDPRRVEKGELPRWKYHPNPIDPETGVYVYEDRQKAKENWRVVKECLNKRRKYDHHQEPQNPSTD
jgi:hypothetical protein